MTSDLPNPRTALVVADMQRDIVARAGSDSGSGQLAAVARAIEAARAGGIAVIYVVVGFRPGHPEVSARNRMFGAVAGTGAFVQDTDGARIHPDVAPRDGEVVVTKRRVSAFAGSDFEVVLRAQGIQRLVLTGIATSGVILSTVRQAADLDYDLVVLSDAVADGDEEVHRVLLEKIIPRQAEVVTVAGWAGSL